MITPGMEALAELSTRITMLEREISALVRTKYPQTLWLQQVKREYVRSAVQLHFGDNFDVIDESCTLYS